uniref:RloB family protein n=1 Tax=Bosea sp. NBC_00436 TaxID=2969620 RepID=A0A9E8CSB7_9HYPH
MRKPSSLKRAPASREAKARFLIFTEGKNTEPAYLNGVKRKFGGALVDVQIVGGAGTPFTLSEKAEEALKAARKIKGKSSFEERDQFWIVFDRDEHPKLAETFEKCKANKINTAFSNPCFELWLILHFADFDKACDRHHVQSHLCSIYPKYKKSGGKLVEFVDLENYIELAEARAKAQEKRREDEGSASNPPFTSVYRLISAIRLASDQNTTKDDQ